jgi:hypothetical protein
MKVQDMYQRSKHVAYYQLVNNDENGGILRGLNSTFHNSKTTSKIELFEQSSRN